jgi:hypothetical protein
MMKQFTSWWTGNRKGPGTPFKGTFLRTYFLQLGPISQNHETSFKLSLWGTLNIPLLAPKGISQMQNAFSLPPKVPKVLTVPT